LLFQQYGALFGQEETLLNDDEVFASLTDDEKSDESNIAAAMARNRERFLAFSFLSKADNNRYHGLKKTKIILVFYNMAVNAF